MVKLQYLVKLEKSFIYYFYILFFILFLILAIYQLIEMKIEAKPSQYIPSLQIKNVNSSEYSFLPDARLYIEILNKKRLLLEIFQSLR